MDTCRAVATGYMRGGLIAVRLCYFLCSLLMCSQYSGADKNDYSATVAGKLCLGAFKK